MAAAPSPVGVICGPVAATQAGSASLGRSFDDLEAVGHTGSSRSKALAVAAVDSSAAASQSRSSQELSSGKPDGTSTRSRSGHRAAAWFATWATVPRAGISKTSIAGSALVIGAARESAETRSSGVLRPTRSRALEGMCSSILFRESPAALGGASQQIAAGAGTFTPRRPIAMRPPMSAPPVIGRSIRITSCDALQLVRRPSICPCRSLWSTADEAV
jgi:hypothetical protein